MVFKNMLNLLKKMQQAIINRTLKILIPVGLFGGVVIIFFGENLIFKKAFFFDDIKYYFSPLWSFCIEEFKKYIIPLWTPFIHCGFPLFNESSIGILYPLHIFLYIIFPPLIAQNYSIALHFFLGSIFIYMYVRKIGLEKIPSIMAGIVFMFSGFFITHLHHMVLRSPGIWMPLIFYFLECYFQKKEIKYVILSGSTIGIQFIAGHPQAALYSILASFLYFSLRFIIDVNKNNIIREIFKSLGILGLIGIIGISLSAIQLIPLYEFISLSMREGGVTKDFATLSSFPPQHFITYIFPYIFGFNSPGSYEGYYTYWSMGYFWEFCCYVGILPLFLTLIAILDKKNKYTLFFSLLLLLSFLLMLGKYSPLFYLIQWLPGFNYLRCPSRFIYLATFSLAVLSGFGLNALIQKENENIKRIVRKALKIFCWVIGLLFSGIIVINIISQFGKEYIISFGREYIKTYIYNTYEHPHPLEYYYDKLDDKYQAIMNSINIFGPAVYIPIILSILVIILMILWHKEKIKISIFMISSLSLLLIDLFIFGIDYHQPISISEAISPPNVVKFLLKDKEFYRIFHSAYIDERSTPESKKRICDKLLSPNSNIVFHISSANFYSSINLKRYSEFLDTFGVEGRVRFHHNEAEMHAFLLKHLNLLSLLNVKYILSTEEINDKRLKTVYSDVIKVSENLEVLPRTFVTAKFKVVKDEEDILNELRSAEFKPGEYIILEEEPNVRCGKPEVVKESKVEITKYLNQEILIDANMKDDGFLVLSDTYYPGWKVFVDGKEDKIYQADYIIRAVYLKKGKHNVKFVYDPISFKIGACISLITLVGVGIFFVVNGVILRKRKEDLQILGKDESSRSDTNL